MSMHVETQRVEVSLELADVTCEVNYCRWSSTTTQLTRNSIVTAFRLQQGTGIIVNERFFSTCFATIGGPIIIYEQLGREFSCWKFFSFATRVDRDDRSGVALDRSSRYRCALTKMIHRRRQIDQ